MRRSADVTDFPSAAGGLPRAVTRDRPSPFTDRTADMTRTGRPSNRSAIFHDASTWPDFTSVSSLFRLRSGDVTVATDHRRLAHALAVRAVGDLTKY